MKFSLLQLKLCSDINYVDIDIPTASLIQELEARRPDCRKCIKEVNDLEQCDCQNCIWFEWTENNNYKEKA